MLPDIQALQAHRGKLWKAFLRVHSKRQKGLYKTLVSQATALIGGKEVRAGFRDQGSGIRV